MYISHKYRFIFLRTPKTASSSLSEFFIRNIPDENAVYTPVDDTKIKGTLNGGYIDKYKKNFKYFHFTLEDLIKEKIITEEQARTYKSFAVLRDPIDRQKSFYYFYKRWKNRQVPPSLEDYKALTPDGFFSGEPNSGIPQTDFLTLNGEVVGEYWLYENLSTHLNRFMSDINVPIKFPLLKHKSNFRKNRNNEIQFDEISLNKIKSRFKKDFELYNEIKGL